MNSGNITGSEFTETDDESVADRCVVTETYVKTSVTAGSSTISKAYNLEATITTTPAMTVVDEAGHKATHITVQFALG